MIHVELFVDYKLIHAQKWDGTKHNVTVKNVLVLLS